MNTLAPTSVTENKMKNTYEISYTDFAQKSERYPRGRRIVVGTQSAKNGLSAIREILAAKGVDAETIESGWSGASNKHLNIAGIPFEAKKLS